jgi:Phage derived protein Gp49-like (DUF891)
MRDETVEYRWAFFGFESTAEGQPVQAWLDALPGDHLDEIKDRLAVLQVMPRSDWDEPFFDPLTGEGGISEIRFDPIKCQKGKFYYRIYGVFEEEETRYTFLHGSNKRERNDRHGKAIAKRRLGELGTDQARIHPIRLD